MIQLHRAGLVADAGDIPALAREFQTRHCVVLRSLIAPDLLEFLQHQVETGRWHDQTAGGIGLELELERGVAVGLVFFLANVPPFLDVVRAITGCSFSAFKSGRIYRMIPHEGHFDTWHGDNTNDRIVGMSINLSPQGYEGGLFQLRDRTSEAPLVEIANTGWGDALLFRISDDLEHRVGPVVGTEPKTAFAGWFRAGLEGLHEGIRANIDEP